MALSVTRADLTFLGQDLARPECVVVTARGDVFASDRRGGIARVRDEGPPELLLGRGVERFPAERLRAAARPQLHDRQSRAVGRRLAHAAGRRAGAGAARGRRHEPAADQLRQRRAHDRRACASGSRSAPAPCRASRRCARTSPTATSCSRTRAARASSPTSSVSPTRTSSTPRAGGSTSTRPWREGSAASPLKDDGLGPRETVAEFEDGIFPDGFEFDAEGGIWIASVVSNRLLRIAPDGSQTVVLDDGDPEVIARVERNFAEHRLTPRRHRRRPRRRFGQSRERHLRRRGPEDGVSGLAVRVSHRHFPLADRRRTAAALALLTRWERP